MPDFLHDREDFDDLIAVVADEHGIDPVLVEKDYWIMHSLWGLQALGFDFQLKGGTSLSKGFGIIHRFSEDIDIRIEPPANSPVKVGRNHDKPAHIDSRRHYYAELCERIQIPGIEKVERDTAFDDEKMRSAGIRLLYPSRLALQAGVKTGILLELGFDDTSPNEAVSITSWAYERAIEAGISVADNRAVAVLCYAPTHTFVEKLQTISTKYRRWRESGEFPANFLRHYYDIYCLLDVPSVAAFIGTEAYEIRKDQRFRTGDEKVIARNPGFLLTEEDERRRFVMEYRKTAALYYRGQPEFEDLLGRINQYLARL